MLVLQCSHLCLQPQIFANDDLAYGITDVSVEIPVLYNDTKFITNIDASSVSTDAVIQPSNGSVLVNADGTITYVPDTGFLGEDTFEYSVCSLEYPSVCNTATVKVKISDCPTPTNRNLVFGQVFLDIDGDMVNNDGIGIEDITINVYEDLNTNGVLDGGDIPLATSPTATTDALGNYSFEVPTYDNTISDDFSSGNYSGGSTGWSGSWTESGESDGASNGDITVILSRLKVENNKSVYREVNLLDAAFATISFEVFEEGDLEIGDQVKVEICSDNTFTNCQVLYFSADDFTSASISGTVIEPNKLTATSHLRVEIDGYTSNDEEFFLDNVVIYAAIRGKNILIETDLATVPSIYNLSTDNIELATFPSGSTGNCEKINDFGFLGCSMTDPGLAVTCNDSGTPMDSSDDTFTFTLNPDGLRFGGSYNVSGDVTGSGTYGAPVLFGPFPSTDFEKTITIVDDTGNCGLIDVKVNISISQCLSTTVPTSVDFDGVNDYFEAPSSDINTLDEYTLSFWVKPEFLPTGGIGDKTFVLGQKDMFEVTIGNNASAEPQIWAQHFYGAGPSSQDLAIPIDATNWNHYTYVVNYNTETIIAYKNGEQVGTLDIIGNTRLTNTNPLRVGSKRDTQPDPGEENFEGWLDEIRIFSGTLTEDQIQRLVYQEIEDNAGVLKGSVIDKNIVDISTSATIPWASLLTYYNMSDIADGKVIDKSAFTKDAQLFNITTLLTQTAPLPYETVADGTWNNENTWLHGDVWDIEDVANNKDWSIVHLHDNVTTAASHKHLGLIIDAGKTFTVGDTGLDDQDFEINNTWYLELNGTIDLQDDSQLIQGLKSDLVTGANGKILRRQEGTSNKFWYNYWSSPVGSLGATTLTDNNGSTNNANNTPFNLDMIKDGNGADIGFTTAYDEIGKISTYWLYTFQNGITYYDWQRFAPTDDISPGFGYTQKGIGNGGIEQQYTFEGKPNNGTILIIRR